MFFKRLLKPQAYNSSCFIFGPRMTGKTTLLTKIKSEAFIDLLDPELELQYRAQPRRFWEQVSALGENATIIIDEIQKVPVLLNYIQMGIDQYAQKYILSGSSARKLKRGGANLLGGRALDLRLHPLTIEETETKIEIDSIIQYGALPKICSLLYDQQKDLVIGHLKSYITTYIKEEIQAEALTRNVGSFQRFLTIAAQSNGQVIEFANISRDSSVPASTVKEYYQILEDTLIGFLLWPFGHSERKKTRPKSYFFDCGVVRSLQNRLNDPPTPQEKGFLFETWLINELIRLKDYYNKPNTFSFLRERNHEIDIIISDSRGPVLAIECKSGNTDISRETVKWFKQKLPKVPLVVASLLDNQKRIIQGIEVIPWNDVVSLFLSL